MDGRRGEGIPTSGAGTWPGPPLVIAVEKEVDWTFGRVGGRPTKALPWRGGYASACPKCGAVIGAVR